MTGDNVTITALTADATDVSITMAGDTNTITTATLSGVTTLTIDTAGATNTIGSLGAAALTDLTLNITDGDFSLSTGSSTDLIETVTVTGAGEITSIAVDVAATALTTIDLSGFSGSIATSGIDLSALTVGVDIVLGELTGATTSAATGQILLNANTASDTIEFSSDFDGFIMIDGFEAGGLVVSDNIDLSAFGLGGTSDLTIATVGTDTTISAGADEFSFTIVLTGVTAGALSANDFVL